MPQQKTASNVSFVVISENAVGQPTSHTFNADAGLQAQLELYAEAVNTSYDLQLKIEDLIPIMLKTLMDGDTKFKRFCKQRAAQARQKASPAKKRSPRQPRKTS